MAISVATLGLSLDSSGMRAGLNDLRQVERAGNRAADALDDAGRRGKKATDTLASGFGALKTALATLGVAAAIKQVVSINDEYARITGRLKLVTTGTEQLAQVQEQLFQVAQRTGSTYADTAELYTRVAQNTKDLGLSQKELLGFTETTAQAFQVSGASAQEAAGAIRQLTQALASGTFRGEEFNSVAEQGPRILQALVDSLGVTRGELRSMAADGKLTAKVVIDALQGQAGAIQDEFSKLPRTVGRAMTELENEVKKAIAGADVSPLTTAIDDLKATLTDPAVIQGITSIAQGLITLAGLAAKAAGAFGNLGKSIGESLARAGGHIVPEEELERLKSLREEAQRFGDASLALARTNEINRLVERFPALREAVARDVGGSVAPVLAFAQSLSTLGSNAADVTIPMRELAGVMVPFRDGKPAEATKKFSEEIEKQLVTMRAVYDLLKQGVPLEEAQTRAKLADAGASAAQVAEYLKLEAALDRAAESKKKLNDRAKDLIQSLEEEYLLTNDLTKSEEVRISLANGYYGVVSAGQAAQLQALADLITAREEDKKKTEEQIEAQKKLRELAAFELSQKDFIDTQGRGYQRQLDDIGMGPAARRYSAGANQIEDQFLGQRQNLNDQLTRGDINQDVYDKQLAMLDNYQRQAIAQWDTYYAALEQKGADFTTGFNDVVLSYLDSTRNVGASLANDLVGALDNAADSLSNLAAEFILFGEGGKAAIAQIARGLATELLSSLIKVGVQMGVNALLGQTLGAAAVTAAGAQAAAAAAAWTPAAFAASVATLGAAPAVGATAYTAGLAGVVASTQASTLAGGAGFEEGGYTGNIGRKEVAGVVHGQEFVMNAEATRRNRGLLDHLNAGGSPTVRPVVAPQFATAAAAGRPSLNLKVENRIDKGEILGAVDSDEFDEILENRIGRNASRYRSRLGIGT